MHFDLPTIRSKFPALRHPVIFFDNPGGTQVAQPVLDRMNALLPQPNLNISSFIGQHGNLPPTPLVPSGVIDTKGSVIQLFLYPHVHYGSGHPHIMGSIKTSRG
jgi:hypothetical protein